MLKETSQEADSKNILTFSGRRWCCHWNTGLLFPCCQCLRAVGSGLCCRHCLRLQHPLFFLPVPVTLQSCCSPGLVPLHFPFRAVTAPDLAVCSKKSEMCFCSLLLSGFIYYLLMTSRGHSSDGFCYDDCRKILRLC